MVDGPALLLMTEDDLRQPPLSLSCLGDIKRLGKLLNDLKAIQTPIENGIVDDKLKVDDNLNSIEEIAQQTPGMVNSVTKVTTSTTFDGYHTFRMITREEFIRHIESPDTKVKSLLKLALAFMYCSISLFTTAFVMVIVHDRVPDMKLYPPLPDLVLDNLPLIPWAFELCEMIGVCMAIIWLTILIFHKERVVIMRRMFSLVGTVFLLRCVTMLITSLSVPGVHLACRSKTFGTMSEKFRQAFHIWSKLGMSINNVRTCGDYLFSGHTTIITLLNHFITEYTPENWHMLHTATWIMNFFGVFFILAGHEHYSIDVFIAFYISSRMFLYYHTYAYNHDNLTTTDARMRIWFPLGWFFESGGVGRVENVFDLPFSLKWKVKRTSIQSNDGGMVYTKKETQFVEPIKTRCPTTTTTSTTNGHVKNKKKKI
uniref:Sphingomyelin synthase-like domain-containing protein n=1 Tax=Panagrolaimus sp. JU765 TaxID=591449 RepID=A0AC34RJR7_9BILA